MEEQMKIFNKNCLRKIANITQMDKKSKFDNISFQINEFSNDLEIKSPKLLALLQNIKRIDSQDLKKHGTYFKHMILSDVKQGGAGARAITAGLLLSGFQMIYDNKLYLLSDSDLLKTRSRNFVVMTGTPIYKMTFKAKKKREILTKYNQRPNNNNGDLCRIIVLDSSYREGIDLFDVKYVHIFEPQTSRADLRQAIGRATRLCGTSGLEFHPKKGWPLNVYLYDVIIPPSLIKKWGENTLFKLYMKYSGINIQTLSFVEELEKLSIFGSVDYELTENIHGFKLETQETADLKNNIYGGSPKNFTIICQGKCGSRPTHDIPISLSVFYAVFFSQERMISKIKKDQPIRSFFCDLLKKDTKFCDGVKQAYKDPVNYIKEHEKSIVNALLLGRHRSFSTSSRNSFLRFVWGIIDKKSLTSKTTGKSNLIDESKRNKINDSIDNVPILSDSVLNVPSPQNLLSFDDLRKYVRENYLQYSWPPVKLMNLCADNLIPNDVNLDNVKLQETKNNKVIHYKNKSAFVTFSPTQEFVRHFFTPQSSYKGILNFHSLGSGKSCCAIATATTTFAPQKWTILWVTKASLKSDIFKNHFDLICNLQIQNLISSGLIMPDKSEERMRLLTKEWNIRSMSYKQFTNMIDQKNSFYIDLVKKNGNVDPLKKTLLIIDEAHKLYGGDLQANEKPDMIKFKSSLMHSYHTSGHESVRLMLMTGTPITNNAMELIKLINLMKLPQDQLPEDFKRFASIYLDDMGKFTVSGSKKYLNDIAGYISYLNREGDARQFAQPHITSINVPMSLSEVTKDDLQDLKNDILQKSVKNKDNLHHLIQDIKNKRQNMIKEKRSILDKCKSLPRNQKVDCRKKAVDEINEITDKIFLHAANKKLLQNQDKLELSEMRQDLKEKRRIFSTDISQQGVIERKCIK